MHRLDVAVIQRGLQESRVFRFLTREFGAELVDVLFLIFDPLLLLGQLFFQFFVRLFLRLEPVFRYLDVLAYLRFVVFYNPQELVYAVRYLEQVALTRADQVNHAVHALVPAAAPEFAGPLVELVVYLQGCLPPGKPHDLHVRRRQYLRRLHNWCGL